MARPSTPTEVGLKAGALDDERRRLAEDYVRLARWFARRYRGRIDPDEAASICFLALCQAARVYPRDAGFGFAAHARARMRCTLFVARRRDGRRRARFPAFEPAAVGLLSGREDDDDIARAERRAELERAIGWLPRPGRDVLRLRLEGAKETEVIARLAIERGTARRLYASSVERLRELLAARAN